MAGGGGFSLLLLVPPPDAMLKGDRPVLLRVMDGRRSLTFLMDGARVSAQRQASWVPGGPGFYAIAVLDADGGVCGCQLGCINRYEMTSSSSA